MLSRWCPKCEDFTGDPYGPKCPICGDSRRGYLPVGISLYDEEEENDALKLRRMRRCVSPRKIDEKRYKKGKGANKGASKGKQNSSRRR